MGTVTFMPRTGGYLVGMNRETPRNRPQDHGPQVRSLGRVYVVHPTTSTGGTWIALNSYGITLALLPWQRIPLTPSVPSEEQREPEQILPELLSVQGDQELSDRLAKLSMERVAPFRLIGIFPAQARIVEWLWNQERWFIRPRSWRPRLWASSLQNEEAVQKERRALWEKALQEPDAGTPIWLRRFHRMHVVQPDSASICVHGEAVCTSSYTEILVVGRRGQMTYHAGPPCLRGRLIERLIRVFLPSSRPSRSGKAKASRGTVSKSSRQEGSSS